MLDLYAAAIAPLLDRVRTDARGVKAKGGKPYKQDAPLDLEALRHHVNGGPAYGGYPIRPGESVCSVAVIDLDSHKGETPWGDMADKAAEIVAEFAARGLVAHPWRSSGGAGIHLIVTWGRAQDARSVRAMLAEALDACGLRDGAGGVAKGEAEIFPKQDHVAIGAYGNYFFLPGAFESVPLDEFTLEPCAKSAMIGYRWQDSADVPLLPPEAAPVVANTGDVDLDEVAAALACVPNTEATDYDTWLRIIAAIHECDAGEDGRELAEAWSEQSPKHERAWFEHSWAHFRTGRTKGKKHGAAGAGSIFRLARLNGWEPYRADVEAALDAIDIAAAVAGIPASVQAPAAPVATVANTGPLYLRHAKTNAAIACVSNVEAALSDSGVMRGMAFGFDEFRGEAMIADRPGNWRRLNDVDLTRVRIMFERMADPIVGVGREMMRDTVGAVAERNKFDSGQVWLAGLSWDGVPRVEGFLRDYFGAEDSPYSRAVSRYAWTALAGRIIEPGAQADMVPIFTGAQGLGKSTALQLLVPAPDLFAEINLGDKDDNLARLLRGRVVVELGELKGIRARDVEHTKAFLTRRRESWIPKYQEHAREYARRCVFFGTTNEDEFLEDQTGARRFLPLRVGTIDRDRLLVDRFQLWAEAREIHAANVAAGRTGIEWAEAEKLAAAEHDEFTVEDAWSHDVERWLSERDDPTAPFTAVECAKGALLIPGHQLHAGTKKRVAGVLRRLGYQDGRATTNGKRARVWATREAWATHFGTLITRRTGQGQ